MRKFIVLAFSIVVLAMILSGKRPSGGETNAKPSATEPVAVSQATPELSPPPETPRNAPILDGAYTPLTKQSAPKLYAAWGKQGIDRINAAVQSAVSVTSASPKCDEVFTGGYSFDRSQPKKSIVVFTDCSNGERFYFTEEEANGGSFTPTAASDGLAATKDSQALRACEDLVKSKVRFPSSMDVSAFSSEVTRGTHGINVALVFEARNALGAMLPQVAYCVINETGSTELLSIKDR